MEEKRPIRVYVILFLILFIFIGAIAIHLYGNALLHQAKNTSILFPWDPLEWDTLRDSPLVYKSLGESLEDYPIYEYYIKDPSRLGFSPDESYFKSVLSLIKSNHISEYNKARLTDGCEKELTKLFKEAKMDIKPSLSSYDIEKDFVPRLTEQYGAKINHDVLVFAALRGLLRGLNDPHTNILTPKDFTMLMERLQEKSFGGIGVYIELDSSNNNALTILEPIEGTPAYEAGVHAGDVVENIGGKSTKNITLEEAVARMRGPKGSHVTIKVKRKGIDKLIAFQIVRADINVPSISFHIVEGDIGYIRIRMFGTETKTELDKALKGLINPPESQDNKVKALILDLRNNSGGYLQEAVDVSSRFIPYDAVVFKRLDKNGKISDFHTQKCTASNLPLVVLVNRFSASSSEIVAGALKCNKAGVLMGDRTFGKGSVQQIYPLASGSALKLTVSYFLTPEGKIINKKGLRPDIYVDMKPNLVGKDKDTQLTEAISYLKKKAHAPVTEAQP